MSSCSQHLSSAGQREISLRNQHVRVSIQPDAGGKITDLINQRSARNWLWCNPHLPTGKSRYGVDYGRELDSGGWDEVLLSMSPSTLTLGDGLLRHIPDHGDVVGQSWQVLDASVTADGAAICDMTVSGRALQYEFRRIITLGNDNSHLDVSYSLTNGEAFALPWYWSMHALLPAQPDLQIELPRHQDFRVDHSTHGGNGVAAPDHSWPYLPVRDGTAINLSRCFDEDAAPGRFASKVFVRSPDSGLVSVLAADTGERLAIRYDPADLPWLGLWLNNGGWSGCNSDPYVNLGIEPTTAAFDSLAEAVAADSISWLPSGETRSWALAVELHA